MRKISYILISGCITLSIIGCDETFDTSNTSEGILSLSENGLTILQSYNVGEKYNADLWIQHGGLELNNSTVTFTVDKSLLDSLNTADGTSYQILPEDCYQMTNTTVNVPVTDWQKALSYTTRQRFMRCAAMTMFNTFSHSKQALQERS